MAVIRAPAKTALTNSVSVPFACTFWATSMRTLPEPSGSTPCVVTIVAITRPATTLPIGEIVQSSPTFHHAFRGFPCRPASGTRKFSVKSSPRPTIRKTKPMPNPTAPTTPAASLPKCGSRGADTTASRITPAAMSKPAASAVDTTSSTGRPIRRSPSARDLSKISSGPGTPLNERGIPCSRSSKTPDRMAMERHIVGLGGGGDTAEQTRLLNDYVLGVVGKERPRMLWVPTAVGDDPSVGVSFSEAFATRADVRPLPTFPWPPPDVRELILQQDAICVCGGNTANMLAIWRVHGIDRYLHEAWEAGVVLWGQSAGMICWFEAGVTDSFGPHLDGVECLGFLPGSACPHYDG